MTTQLLQSLPDSGPPAQLFILLHSAGSPADDLLPLAKVLRDTFPQAALLLPTGFDTAAALIDWVRGHQQRLGVGAAATALAGFSQGGTVSLEAAVAAPELVGRVLAFSSRFAQLPEAVPPRTTFHFFHGGQDTVIPARHATAAFEHVAALDEGDATLDIADAVDHTLHPALLERAVFRLTHHVPPRMWREAMRLAAAPDHTA